MRPSYLLKHVFELNSFASQLWIANKDDYRWFFFFFFLRQNILIYELISVAHKDLCYLPAFKTRL